MAVTENRNPVLHLYKVSQDSDCGEFYIPLQSRRAVAAPGHKRWKRENFSGNIKCAWSDDGLHVDFTIRDRQVRNNAALERLWSEDCLEILLDVRKERSGEYNGNSMHIFVAPPCKGNADGRFYLRNARDPGRDFFCQSFLHDRGWGGTVFIPWNAFPGFTATVGTAIGLGFQVCDDYGRPAGNPFFNAQYLRFGNEFMAQNAELLPRWVLGEKFIPSAANDLSNVIAVDLPKLLFSQTVDADIVVAEALQNMIATLEWKCEIKGHYLAGSSGLEKIVFDLPDNVFGHGTVKLIFRDAEKEIVGVMELPFQRFNGEKLNTVLDSVITLVRQADLPELAKTSPERIAGYFGLLNTYEQLKRMIFLERTEDLELLAEEISLRMELLQGRKIQSIEPLFELLNISASWDGQVSVEFPRRHPGNRWHNDAVLKIYCGAVPLAQVHFTKVENSNAFRRQIRPALYRRDIFPAENKEHLFFKFTAGSSCHVACFMTADALPLPGADDKIMIFENASAEHTAILREYARNHNLTEITLPELANGMQVLCAGSPASESKLGKLYEQTYNFYWTTAGCNDLILQMPRNLQAHIRCISYAGCALIADILTQQRPFARSDNRMLTRLVAEELARRGIKPEKIAENHSVMAADVHCHSIYSDGVATPAGLMAAALYGQMDFLMIADHETADGALELQMMLKKYNFDFVLIAGEENSLPDGHFNSYPLTESIPANLSLVELIKAAHQQEALVQYNHPASYSNRRDLQLNGIAGSGLEAWEHEFPAYAVNWQELPGLTGSSDNHNSSFPTERTICCLESVSDKIFQNSVRQRQTGITDALSAEFVYAPELLKGMLLTALQEPEKYLLQPHCRRLQKSLQYADIAGLFNDLPGATPAELGQ